MTLILSLHLVNVSEIPSEYRSAVVKAASRLRVEQEKQFGAVCPRCGRAALKERSVGGGARLEECSCGYLMVWKAKL